MVTQEIIISYSRTDHTWAEWIAWQLQHPGPCSVTLHPCDFPHSSPVLAEMKRTLQKCDRVLVLVSPDSLATPDTEPFPDHSPEPNADAEPCRVTLVRVRACDFGGMLNSFVGIDLVDRSAADARRELLQAIALPRQDFPEPSAVTASAPPFPGTLPAIWNLPHRRNPNYIHAGSQLTHLHDELANGRPDAPWQVFTGRGGLGKTQLAIEYAYRHSGDYDLVWWVRGAHPSVMQEDFAALARELTLPEKDATNLSITVEAVRGALAQRPRSLIIFDHAGPPEDLAPCLPRGACHVLITARHGEWLENARVHPLSPWLSAVAVEFLTQRTGSSATHDAAALAYELGYHPLALELAASYIETTGSNFRTYLTSYLARRRSAEAAKASQDPVALAVGLACGIVLAPTERSARLRTAVLNFCAFLAADDLPRDVLIALIVSLDADPFEFDHLAAALQRFALLQRGTALTLSMPPLVQEALRKHIDGKEHPLFTTAVVSFLSIAFPTRGSDFDTWNSCTRLLPHALAASERAEVSGHSVENLERLLQQIGLFIRGRQQYVTARGFLERALRAAEQQSGPNGALVPHCLNSLGNVLLDLHDRKGARAAFERALRIGEKLFGTQHPKITSYLNNLAAVLGDLGDHAGARAMLERTVQICEQHHGPEHPSLAVPLGNLGSILRELGDLPAARATLERALRLTEKEKGPRHPKVAARINDLGIVLRELGDLPAAQAAFERAIETNHSSAGTQHPEVARSLHHLGTVLQAAGQLPSALSAYEQALAKFRHLFGDHHTSTLTVRERLDSLLKILSPVSHAPLSPGQPSA